MILIDRDISAFERSGYDLVETAGFDGLEPCAKPTFPSIRQPVREIADTVISTLLDRTRRPSVPPRQILLEPSLVPGR